MGCQAEGGVYREWNRRMFASKELEPVSCAAEVWQQMAVALRVPHLAAVQVVAQSGCAASARTRMLATTCRTDPAPSPASTLPCIAPRTPFHTHTHHRSTRQASYKHLP